MAELRKVQMVQGCKGDTHFLHFLHPSARFAPICQVCTHLPGLHPSARFAPFCFEMLVRYRGMRIGSDPPSPAHAGSSLGMSCMAPWQFYTLTPPPADAGGSLRMSCMA